MNQLFVAYKPSGIGSNAFLGRLKRQYGVKKAGFSGTLDPFARGVLIVAFGKYTQLFRFLNKQPKTYRGTLWLGAKSDTLDIDSAIVHHACNPIDEAVLLAALQSFVGAFTYVPPKFSAKKINGARAYDLARSGKEVTLQTVTSTIHEIKLLNYSHPFVHFEATVSEGTYIRSLAQHIAQKLGTKGILSSLERTKEGAFVYQNNRPLPVLDYINVPHNFYLGDPQDIQLGKKLALNMLTKSENGTYIIHLEDNFAIICIENSRVHYLLNKVPLC
jgi:tRNA pseudouridine55 synthase